MFKIIGAGSGTFFLDPDLELLKSGSWIRIRNKSFRIPNTGKKNKQIKNVRIISLKSAQMILKSLYKKNCNGHWLKKNKFLALQIYNQKRKKYIAQTIYIYIVYNIYNIQYSADDMSKKVFYSSSGKFVFFTVGNIKTFKTFFSVWVSRKRLRKR